MAVFTRIFIILLLTLLSSGHVWAGNKQQEMTRIFWSPKFHQARLSYCTSDHKKCGLALANEYCCLMGYKKAVHEVIDNNIGLANYFDVREQCQGWKCNGFKLIRCAKYITHRPPNAYYYRSEQFNYPRFNHYRVAWCYKKSTQCGRKAAHSFCRRMGFTKEHGFEQEKSVNATKNIGDQKLCFGNTCNAFKYIRCYR